MSWWEILLRHIAGQACPGLNVCGEIGQEDGDGWKSGTWSSLLHIGNLMFGQVGYPGMTLQLCTKCLVEPGWTSHSLFTLIPFPSMLLSLARNVITTSLGVQPSREGFILMPTFIYLRLDGFWNKISYLYMVYTSKYLTHVDIPREITVALSVMIFLLMSCGWDYVPNQAQA